LFVHGNLPPYRISVAADNQILPHGQREVNKEFRAALDKGRQTIPGREAASVLDLHGAKGDGENGHARSNVAPGIRPR
jgi:hypothetical protein